MHRYPSTVKTLKGKEKILKAVREKNSLYTKGKISNSLLIGNQGSQRQRQRQRQWNDNLNALIRRRKHTHTHTHLSSNPLISGSSEAWHDVVAVQSLSHIWLFATPWAAARQASLSFTSSWSLLKLMSIESVMPSNHLIPCHPLLLQPSIFPSIRVFTNKSALCIK